MITFAITEFPEKQVVGVLKDGDLIGTIYPTAEGIEVVPNRLMTCSEKVIKIGHSVGRNVPCILINLLW